jgi:hypothetical protein
MLRVHVFYGLSTRPDDKRGALMGQGELFIQGSYMILSWSILGNTEVLICPEIFQILFQTIHIFILLYRVAF